MHKEIAYPKERVALAISQLFSEEFTSDCIKIGGGGMTQFVLPQAGGVTY